MSEIILFINLLKSIEIKSIEIENFKIYHNQTTKSKNNFNTQAYYWKSYEVKPLNLIDIFLYYNRRHFCDEAMFFFNLPILLFVVHLMLFLEN